MKKDELFRLYKMDCVEEIRAIYNKLPEEDKPTAQIKIQELTANGFSNMWIYLALNRLIKKDGGFYQWKSLLNYPSFQQEITELEGEYLRYKRDFDNKKKEINESMERCIEKWGSLTPPTEHIIIKRDVEPPSRSKSKLKQLAEDCERFIEELENPQLKEERLKREQEEPQKKKLTTPAEHQVFCMYLNGELNETQRANFEKIYG